MAISLKNHNNGYFGYMSQDVKNTLAEMQDVTQHLSSEIQFTPNGDLAEHSLNVFGGGLNCYGELAVVSGNVVLNHSLLPVHADNDAAHTAGLEVGRVYSTPDGTLKIRYI